MYRFYFHLHLVICVCVRVCVKHMGGVLDCIHMENILEKHTHTTVQCNSLFRGRKRKG